MDCGQKMDNEEGTKLGRPPRPVPRATRHISFEPEVLKAANEHATKGISDFMNDAAKDYLRRKFGVKIR